MALGNGNYFNMLKEMQNLFALLKHFVMVKACAGTCL